MTKNNPDQPIIVEVKNDLLSISIGINTLAFASSWENGGPVENLKIQQKDAQKWAEAIAREIDKDIMDDPIPINKFLDDMIIQADENLGF